jgi:phasin family protein
MTATPKTAKKIESSMEPMLEYNTMMADAAEAVFTIEMNCARTLTKLGIDNLIAGMKVRTAGEMLGYAEAQKSLMGKMSDMYFADAKALADIGYKFMDSSFSLFESSFKSAAAAATSDLMKAA